MKRLLLGMTAFLVVNMSGCNSNSDKIVGTWNVTKMDGKELPKEISMSIEFTKDGKMIMTASLLGIEDRKEGTYKVEGDKINGITKGKDGKEEGGSLTIRSITGDTMVLYDEEDRQEMELKRK